MTISDAELDSGLKRELQSMAAERMRRIAARAALRREHATRRANGLIDGNAARAARLRPAGTTRLSGTTGLSGTSRLAGTSRPAATSEASRPDSPMDDG